MTGKEAFYRILGSDAYNKLQLIVAKVGIGEGDKPEKCRQTIRNLCRRIRKDIRILRRELPEQEKPEFDRMVHAERYDFKRAFRAASG